MLSAFRLRGEQQAHHFGRLSIVYAIHEVKVKTRFGYIAPIRRENVG